jgi:hypothetical protein
MQEGSDGYPFLFKINGLSNIKELYLYHSNQLKLNIMAQVDFKNSME